MINSFIEFYKEHLTSYGLVFTYFKWQYRLCKFALFMGLFGIMFIFPLAGYKLYGSATLLFSLITIAGFCGFLGININSKKVLDTRYKIVVNDFIWRVESFEIKRSEILVEYLCTQHLFNSKSINLIIDLLKKESEKRKSSPFIKSGIILFFLGPVWVQFIIVLYKYANDPKTAFILMAIVSAIVIGLFSFGGMTRNYFLEILDFLFVSDHTLIEDFINLLEDCLLRYPDLLKD